MTYLFYSVVCLLMVLVKTTLVPGQVIFETFYDLLIPFIVYLGLNRPGREGIPLALFFGFIMDSLSGGTPGLYVSIYFWIIVAMRALSRYLHAGNWIFTSLAIGLAVAFELLALLFYLAAANPDVGIPSDALRIVLIQIGWAMLTGPLLMYFISAVQRRIDALRREAAGAN